MDESIAYPSSLKSTLHSRGRKRCFEDLHALINSPGWDSSFFRGSVGASELFSLILSRVTGSYDPGKGHCFFACSGINLTNISTGTPFNSAWNQHSLYQ